MRNRSPQVDAYIAKSADFAKPILAKVRNLFHKASPQIGETIKWGVPHFEHNGLVGGIAAFKKHVSFGFWRSKELSDPAGLFQADPKASMCAVKVSSVVDLPADKIIIAYIKEAVALNERSAAAMKERSNRKAVKKTAKKKSLAVPAYFLAALKKNKKAFLTFEGFSYTNRKEYVEWVVEAKQASTRERRLGTAVEWMAEGKPRNWKYAKC